MVGFDFIENPLIADRIQLSISIPLILYEDKGEVDHYLYVQSVFKAYLSNKREYKVLYGKNKQQYYIEVDEDCYKSEFPFCSSKPTHNRNKQGVVKYKSNGFCVFPSHIGLLFYYLWEVLTKIYPLPTTTHTLTFLFSLYEISTFHQL